MSATVRRAGGTRQWLLALSAGVFFRQKMGNKIPFLPLLNDVHELH